MPADDVFVGVHGIGDQVEYETVQFVIERVTAFLGKREQVPLGRISSGQNADGVYEYPDSAAPRAAFAEVYWADIPREVVKNGYVLEETTRWARHLVDKLDRRGGGCLAPADRRAIKAILPEVIESIDVVQRLLLLAEWAGKFKFNLKAVLDDFIGDVQLVTEFDPKRRQVLDRFHAAMARAHAYNPQACLYVIAHSEGSVVAFLGLLEAMAANAAWVRQVKGFMTIGSPIDKHLILWPELWKDLHPRTAAGVPIGWYNYSDNGDPVGYELDAARKWLGNAPSLRFVRDVQFSRYLFPGKAHTDYWADDEVFGDFLSAMEIHGASKPLTDRFGVGFVSTLLPYLFALVVLASGVFVFYNAITNCIGHSEPPMDLARNTLAFTALMAGIAVAGRIPRLVRDFRYHLAGLAAAGACCVAFYYLVLDDVCYWLAETVPTINADPRGTLIVVAALIVLVGYVTPLVSDRSGSRLFIVVGALVAVGLALAGVFSGRHGNVLPVLIAGGMFVYLWWLSVLLLDLTFVWHRYVRNQTALRTMRECSEGTYCQPFVSRTFIGGKNPLASAVRGVRRAVGGSTWQQSAGRRGD
jgi:hypothetical protein